MSKEMETNINNQDYLQIIESMPEIVCNMEQHMMHQIEKHGLTMPQFWVLTRLFHAERKLKVSEISESLDLPASSMTEMLDKLEKAGFVKRQRIKDDRRVVVIETTKKSEQLRQKLTHSNLHFFQEFFNKLREDEKQTVLKMIRILREYTRSWRENKPES